MSERSKQHALLTWLLTQTQNCHYCQTPVERYNDILSGFGVDPQDGHRDLTPLQKSYLFKFMATVDHVIPKQSGGKTTRSNVVLACFICNQARHRKRGKKHGGKSR